jgi:hypothetical protein
MFEVSISAPLFDDVHPLMLHLLSPRYYIIEYNPLETKQEVRSK